MLSTSELASSSFSKILRDCARSLVGCRAGRGGTGTPWLCVYCWSYSFIFVCDTIYCSERWSFGYYWCSCWLLREMNDSDYERICSFSSMFSVCISFEKRFAELCILLIRFSRGDSLYSMIDSRTFSSPS